MSRELVQNPNFGSPNHPNDPTHIWIDVGGPSPTFSAPAANNNGGGGGGGGIGLLLAPFLLALLSILLYPLAAAATLGTWWAMERVADVRVGRANHWPYVATIAAPTLVVLWLSMRIDQRLGTFRLYRWTRHVARLLFLGALCNLAMRHEMHLSENASVEQAVRDTFANGPIALYTFGAMAVLHLFLWRATGMRRTWHGWLRALRMRSATLDD